MLMNKVPFSQLWIEEEKYLLEKAQGLSDSAVIVEIGTAQGGSAYIFAKATEGKPVEIYSYDISPSPEALENLKDTPVKIIGQPSREGAEQWRRARRKPINLLFIDGSHTMSSVVQDFNHWAPLLRENAHLVFHDYDPEEKGGVPHLGVKIAVDTIFTSGALGNMVHVGRLRGGDIKDRSRLPLPDDDYFLTWKNLECRITEILKGKYRACYVREGSDRTVSLLCDLLHIEKMDFRGDIPADLNVYAPVLIYERPLASRTSDFAAAHKERVLFLDDLSIFYVFYEIMKSRRHDILKNVRDRKRFSKFEEQLEMLDHFSRIHGMEDIFDRAGLKNIADLSRVIAREIIRLGFLQEIDRLLAGNE